MHWRRGGGGVPQEQTFSNETCGSAGRASQLPPFAGVHFHIMKGCTHRDSRERKAVASLDSGVNARPDTVAWAHLLWCQDVGIPLLAAFPLYTTSVDHL